MVDLHYTRVRFNFHLGFFSCSSFCFRNESAEGSSAGDKNDVYHRRRQFIEDDDDVIEDVKMKPLIQGVLYVTVHEARDLPVTETAASKISGFFKGIAGKKHHKDYTGTYVKVSCLLCQGQLFAYEGHLIDLSRSVVCFVKVSWLLCQGQVFLLCQGQLV